MIYSNLEDVNKRRLGLEISNIMLNSKTPVVFLCVGSDRIVGDCLSPMVGEMIKEVIGKKALVYGTLDSPINYKNLQNTLTNIKEKHKDSMLVIIDSVLGKKDEVGFVKFNKGGVVLGGEYHEGLQAGNYHILGVVNTTGINSLTFLKSVKLGKVIKMSEFIADAIKYAIRFSMV